jgi:hypothetical protein
MAQTTGRSGFSFLMARDIAKDVSNKLETKAVKAIDNENIVTAYQIRNMITEELKQRNQQEIASSYRDVAENTQKDQTLQQYESPIGTADTD